MILIIHNYDKVIRVFDYELEQSIQVDNHNLVHTFFNLGNKFKNRLIVWCTESLEAFINQVEFPEIFHHKYIMASFNVRNQNYINDRIGYVETTPYIKIDKSVTYPTWRMSSCIGGTNSDMISCYNHKDFKNRSFDYTLNSIAKRGMDYGLFCYSSPKLLNTSNLEFKKFKPSNYKLFKFILEHYKTRWAYLTLLNFLVYEKKLLLFPFLISFFTSRKMSNPIFDDVKVNSTRRFGSYENIDVVIPTIGRKEYLYDVLRDLSNQTLLPKKVIVIEQNPDVNSKTELNYLFDETWPFKIDHLFINQTGACNARNRALEKVESDWFFLADDDIRLKPNTLEVVLSGACNYGLKAITISCLRQNEEIEIKPVKQWNTFGSGCSIVSKEVLPFVSFNLAYEHGFGEDGDFGMQIRNLGEDIGYISESTLLHLKAPIGGFRSKVSRSWENDKVQPKPSPTIMLYNLKHQSEFQINGYKTILFLKFFKRQKNKNVVSYFFKMKQGWKKSIHLANQLNIK